MTAPSRRGRYRAPRKPIPPMTWLVAAVGALAIFVVLTLAASAAFAAPAIQTEYNGARWPTNTKPICFTTNTIADRRWVDKVNGAAKAWDIRTDNLRIIARPDCKAAGYTEYVKVYAKDYGDSLICAGVIAKGCFYYGTVYWRQVPSAGPWTNNGWTWVFGYGQTIKLNSDGGVSKRVAAFEIGRAIGLGNTNRYSRDALMAYNSTADWFTFWDIDGWVSSNKPGADALYWKG